MSKTNPIFLCSTLFILLTHNALSKDLLKIPSHDFLERAKHENKVVQRLDLLTTHIAAHCPQKKNFLNELISRWDWATPLLKFTEKTDPLKKIATIEIEKLLISLSEETEKLKAQIKYQQLNGTLASQERLETLKNDSKTLAEHYERLAKEHPTQTENFYHLAINELQSVAEILFKECSTQKTSLHCLKAHEYQLEAIKIAKQKLNTPQYAGQLHMDLGYELRNKTHAIPSPAEKNNLYLKGAEAFTNAANEFSSLKDQENAYLFALDTIHHYLQFEQKLNNTPPEEQNILFSNIKPYYMNAIQSSREPEKVYQNYMSHIEKIINSEKLKNEKLKNLNKFLSELSEATANTLAEKKPKEFETTAYFYQRSASQLLASSSPENLHIIQPHALRNFKRAENLYTAAIKATPNPSLPLLKSAYQASSEAAKLSNEFNRNDPDLYLNLTAGHYALELADHMKPQERTQYVTEAFKLLKEVAQHYEKNSEYLQAIVVLQPLEKDLQNNAEYKTMTQKLKHMQFDSSRDQLGNPKH